MSRKTPQRRMKLFGDNLGGENSSLSGKYAHSSGESTYCCFGWKYYLLQTHIGLSGHLIGPASLNNSGSEWLCGAVVTSWSIGCEFDPRARQLLGERGSALVNPSRTVGSINYLIGGDNLILLNMDDLCWLLKKFCSCGYWNVKDFIVNGYFVNL